MNRVAGDRVEWGRCGGISAFIVCAWYALPSLPHTPTPRLLWFARPLFTYVHMPMQTGRAIETRTNVAVYGHTHIQYTCTHMYMYVCVCPFYLPIVPTDIFVFVCFLLLRHPLFGVDLFAGICPPPSLPEKRPCASPLCFLVFSFRLLLRACDSLSSCTCGGVGGRGSCSCSSMMLWTHVGANMRLFLPPPSATTTPRQYTSPSLYAASTSPSSLLSLVLKRKESNDVLVCMRASVNALKEGWEGSRASRASVHHVLEPSMGSHGGCLTWLLLLPLSALLIHLCVDSSCCLASSLLSLYVVCLCAPLYYTNNEPSSREDIPQMFSHSIPPPPCAFPWTSSGAGGERHRGDGREPSACETHKRRKGGGR